MFVAIIVILSQGTCTRLWRSLSQAVQLDPKNGYAYFLRGQSYLRNGEKPKRRPIFSVREGQATRKVRRLRKGEDRRKSVRRTGDGIKRNHDKPRPELWNSVG